jgi:hypothetical protein
MPPESSSPPRRVIGLAAYDTEAVYTKAQRAAGLADDPDLERRSNNPPGANRNEWAGGNLNPKTQLGIIAIVQDRHSYDYLNPGSLAPVFASPNDQASGGGHHLQSGSVSGHSKIHRLRHRCRERRK